MNCSTPGLPVLHLPQFAQVQSGLHARGEGERVLALELRESPREIKGHTRLLSMLGKLREGKDLGLWALFHGSWLCWIQTLVSIVSGPQVTGILGLS